ncbi:MAG: tryptophan synthase subunit alpha [Micrococcales bacterium]|nr:MAG: tryptophan synthase subunit alpha [Micrococcales bacterium]
MGADRLQPVGEPVRTDAAIDRCRNRGKAAFIGYLPAGFPDKQASIDAAKALVDAGAHVVEIGLPYSDPSMDGPVIQAATAHALAAGLHTTDVLDVVAAVAEHGRGSGTAVVVMTYYNPVLRYGVDAFARDLAAAGGAGLITPDLTPDTGPDWMAAADAHALDRVFLISPNSTDERLAMTVTASRGFVYAASLMGVTGERQTVSDQAATLVARAREAGAARVCVGLGISTPAQAAEVAGFSDGVIVGSALVRCLAQADDPAAGRAEMSRLAGQIAAGIEEVTA